MSEEYVKNSIVYIGKRLLDGKLVQAFYTCDEDGNLLDKTEEEIINSFSDEGYRYFLKIAKHIDTYSVGQVIDRGPDEKGNYVYLPNRFVYCPNKEYIRVWQMRERADMTIMEQGRKAKTLKEGQSSDLFKALLPFREEYSRSMPNRKRALLADILNFITGSIPKK